MAAGAWVAWTATARPRIVVSASVLDFGPVADRKTQTVEVRNAGRAPLKVLAVTSSCGCTTARIAATTLPSRGASPLEITFDAAAHGPKPGPAEHSVYVRTNDTRTPEVEITIRAIVVKEKTP